MEDELYAEVFLASIECDQTGVNAPICTWSSLEDDYLALSTTSKAHFVAASKNESGSVVEKAVARYDYIINKYGTSSYKNFMNRTITPANRNIHILNYNSSIILLIFAEGVISISAVALLLRRKKKKAK